MKNCHSEIKSVICRTWRKAAGRQCPFSWWWAYHFEHRQASLTCLFAACWIYLLGFMKWDEHNWLEHGWRTLLHYCRQTRDTNTGTFMNDGTRAFVPWVVIVNFDISWKILVYFMVNSQTKQTKGHSGMLLQTITKVTDKSHKRNTLMLPMQPNNTLF